MNNKTEPASVTITPRVLKPSLSPAFGKSSVVSASCLLSTITSVSVSSSPGVSTGTSATTTGTTVTDNSKTSVDASGYVTKTGRDGVYTHISEGEISIGDMNDVYVYPNTLVIMEVNGDQLKNWLEFSALNFNQIDPENEEDQFLVNEEERSYNFDTIEGITYEFDVTQEVGNRVQNIQFEGEPVESEDRFYVATNNHRSSGDALDEDVIIALETTMKNRQIIIDYVINHDGPLEIEASDNWSIAPFNAAGNVLFTSDPNAVDYYEDYDRIEIHEDTAGGTTFLYN